MSSIKKLLSINNLSKMLAIKDMKMPSCCRKVLFCRNGKEAAIVFCPLYERCEHKLIDLNMKPSDCPLIEIEEPKTGHWEYGYTFADGNYCKCSECKEIIKCIYPMHYCPNCGAKMESEE